jgi:septum formation protein
MTRLILASASPRRRQLAGTLGFEVLVAPADIDETARAGESPADLVARLARTKAHTISDHWTFEPGDVVIGADTVVAIDDDVLGKPADDADAAAMLGRLSGRTHLVMTGVTLVADTHERTFVETTTVRFAPLSTVEIDAYVATGEPRDKAGAYGIQGGAGRFVLEVHGSYQNIVGLPLAQLSATLAALEQAELD